MLPECHRMHALPRAPLILSAANDSGMGVEAPASMTGTYTDNRAAVRMMCLSHMSWLTSAWCLTPISQNMPAA
jgi:hypothetical protein